MYTDMHLSLLAYVYLCIRDDDEEDKKKEEKEEDDEEEDDTPDVGFAFDPNGEKCLVKECI
jgi:hypothetical protein